MQAPGYPYPAPPPKSGFPVWAIVLLSIGGVALVVVVLIGVMAVLAISGVRGYLSASKSAEATSTIGSISMDATAAYEEEQLGSSSHVLCASASHPVPVSILQVSAKKYMSSSADWSGDPSDQGFTCLKFEMYSPQYYQYDYRRTGGATGAAVGDGFEVEAKGDLDGDGNLSSFKTTGSIVSAGSLMRSPTVTKVDPTE